MAQNITPKKRYGKSHARRQNRVLIPALLGLGGLALLVFAVLSLRGVGGTKAAIEVSGAPSLKVDQEVIDFGDVQLGKTVEATFTVANVGDQPLRFTGQPYIEVLEGC